MVLFRPEFLLPSPRAAIDLNLVVDFERLPEDLPLGNHERRIVTHANAQMNEDAKIDASPSDVHALLRYQLYALLFRLNIFRHRHESGVGTSIRGLQRFKRFEQLVEKHFAKWHQVAEYAEQLGCAEKTLSRATVEVAGVNAKAFITSRIKLEAKRLLAHTELSVILVAERLGFEEVTNFSKFFKRKTGRTPVEFRRRQDSMNTLKKILCEVQQHGNRQ